MGHGLGTAALGCRLGFALGTAALGQLALLLGLALNWPSPRGVTLGKLGLGWTGLLLDAVWGLAAGSFCTHRKLGYPF